MAIVRVEHGFLNDIVNVFEELINGRWMPEGTAISISAGGHLANVGQAAYALDLVEVINRLKRLFPPPLQLCCPWPHNFCMWDK